MQELLLARSRVGHGRANARMLRRRSKVVASLFAQDSQSIDSQMRASGRSLERVLTAAERLEVTAALPNVLVCASEVVDPADAHGAIVQAADAVKIYYLIHQLRGCKDVLAFLAALPDAKGECTFGAQEFGTKDPIATLSAARRLFERHHRVELAREWGEAESMDFLTESRFSRRRGWDVDRLKYSLSLIKHHPLTILASPAGMHAPIKS